jgi:hypothetical protein
MSAEDDGANAEQEEECQGDAEGSDFTALSYGGDGESGSIEFSYDPVDPPYGPLQRELSGFEAYVYGPTFVLSEPGRGVVCLKVPRDFLPLALQVVCGFLSHKILLHLEITLSFYKWTQRPEGYQCLHPTLGSNFYGSCLVQNVITTFFNPNYTPKPHYRSTPFILAPQGFVALDGSALEILVGQGFSEMRASRALTLCNNNQVQLRRTS